MRSLNASDWPHQGSYVKNDLQIELQSEAELDDLYEDEMSMTIHVSTELTLKASQ